MTLAVPRSPSRAARRRHENLTGWALAAPSAALVAVFFLLPLGLTIWMSFFDWPTFGPASPVGIDNYARLASSPDFGSAIVFTIVYTVLTSVVGIALSLGLALLVRPRFFGRTLVRAVLFAPVTIGFAPAGLLWLSMSNARTGILPQLARDLGLAPQSVDWFAEPATMITLVVVMSVWKTAGLAMLVLLIGMDSIPAEIYEASRLDGARAWTTLSRITLPLIIKPLSLVILITVTTTFLGFDQFFTLTKGGPDGSTVTVVYYLYTQAFLAFRQGYAAAAAVVIVGIMLVFSLVQVRLQRGRG